jgi:tripartite-type tricarboxylate transporter receptor subunit TctC
MALFVANPESVRMSRLVRPIVDTLNAEINKAIGRPEIRTAWDRQGAIPMTMSPAEFEAFLHQDIAKWAQVAKTDGAITPVTAQ